MTHSKKQKITENNEKHSNRPVGRCSGPSVDIFGSMEPWTHALSKGLLGLSLNLNILGSKIEICAQNSAFLRKKSPHITQKISEPKQPTDDRTTWPRSPWVVLTTHQKRKKSLGPMSHSCANLQIRVVIQRAIAAGLQWRWSELSFLSTQIHSAWN